MVSTVLSAWQELDSEETTPWHIRDLQQVNRRRQKYPNPGTLD